jgi:hypothetical protein
MLLLFHQKVWKPYHGNKNKRNKREMKRMNLEKRTGQSRNKSGFSRNWDNETGFFAVGCFESSCGSEDDESAGSGSAIKVRE